MRVLPGLLFSAGILFCDGDKKSGADA